MGSQGPGDIPKAVRRRRARVQRQAKRAATKRPAQPPSSTARQGAAFGTRPARPLPKPAPAPKPVRVPRQQTAGAAEAQRQVARHKIRAPRKTKAPPSAPRAPASAIPGLGAVPRARAIRAVAKSGGDFDLSIRSGDHSDAAAARAARKIGKPISVGEDNHYYVKQKRAGLPDRHLPVDPFSGKVDRKYLLSGKSKAGQLETESIQAPALKVLDQTTRPVHGVMAAAKTDVKRGGVGELFKVHAPGSKAAKERGRAFKRGVQLKDRTLGSDVLKAAGVKNKAVASAAGFALDVVADPLTYVTGGTGSVAEKAAAKASTRVRRKALQHGLGETEAKAAARDAAQAAKKTAASGRTPREALPTPQEAAQEARTRVVSQRATTAAERAHKAAPPGRGVTVTVAGHEVPGIRRATAATARGVRKGTRKAVGDRLATEIPAAVRNVVREMAPRVRASGVTHEQMASARSLARSGRSRVSESANRADLLESDFVRRLKPDDKQRVVDAIERDNLSRIIGPNKKAIDKLAKDDPKEFKRLRALADRTHRARSEMAGEYRAGLRSGAIQKRQPISSYLTKQDLGRLDKSAAADRRAQQKAISRSLAQPERHARENALISARQQLLDAQRTLRAELAKPVGRRRGVAGLEARVQATKQAWQHARRPSVAAGPQRAEALTQVRLPGTTRPPSAASLRYEGRVANTEAQRARLQAAQNIPVRSHHETDVAYVRRVRQHAIDNNLPQLRKRADKLLAKKPAQRARGYYPHITQEEIRTGEQSLLGKLAGRDTTSEPSMAGGNVARTARSTRAGKRRVENRPLNVLNPAREAAEKAPYSTDVAAVIPNYVREVARSSQPAEFAKGIAAQVGRHLKPGEKLNQGEELYRLGFKGGKYGLYKETGRTAAPAARTVKAGPTVRAETAAPRSRSGGQYVALPSNFFEHIEGTLAGTRSKHNMKVIQALDATQNLWKRGAITTLAFHVRNMIGDVAAGYNLPGVGGSLRHVLPAIKVTRRASESHRFLRPRTAAEQKGFERAVLKPNEKSTIKAGGREMPLDEFIKLGVEHGVPDTGRIARDIIGSRGTEAKLHATARGRSVTRPFRGRAGNRVNVWLTSRENVMRWAAFKHGLDRGMTPAEAADMASLYHIDYGEMSSFEREILRRAMPFYTWTARSLPVAALTAIQRPGKFANFEAAREETGQGFTGETEQALRDAMPDSVKRQVPIVVRVGNSNYAVSASLPVTLLNEFPDPGNPGKFLDEAWHFGFGMVGPYGTPVPGVGVKQLFEIGMNKSAFTRRDIRPQYTAGRVPAPEWVGRMPDIFKRQVGAVQGPDKDTGKTIWFWDGRVDYGTRLVPGAAQQASQAAAGARPGQEKLPTAVGILSPVTGVRVDKLGEKARTQAGRARLSKELDRLNNQAELLNLQGIHHDNPTPEYKRLRKRINEINKVLRPRKKKAGGGSSALTPSDIGLGSTGSDLTPEDIGLGG